MSMYVRESYLGIFVKEHEQLCLNMLNRYKNYGTISVLLCYYSNFVAYGLQLREPLSLGLTGFDSV